MSLTGRLKVLHVSAETGWRGGERQLFWLHQELVSQQIDSKIACPQESVLYTCLTDQASFSFNRGNILRCAWRLRNLCENSSFDLIHAHDSKAHTICLLAKITGLKVPLVVTRRSIPRHGGFLSRWKYNHPKNASIVAISLAIKNELSTLTPSQIKVIYSGIPLENSAKPHDLHAELELSRAEQIIGFVGALSSEKGPDRFLDVAHKIAANHAGVHFCIFGDGPLQMALEKKCQQLEITEKVHFLGFRDDLKHLWSSMSCMLVTSRSEGLNTSILDAFANEVPVIAFDVGGVSELVAHRKTGMLCGDGNVVEMSEAFDHLVLDEDLMRILQRNAKQKVGSFSVKEMAQKYIRLYNDVFSSSSF